MDLFREMIYETESEYEANRQYTDKVLFLELRFLMSRFTIKWLVIQLIPHTML